MKISIEKILKTALKAAVKGGNILKDGAKDIRKDFITKESFRDVVTSIDIRVQEEIIKILNNHKEKYKVVAEEGENTKVNKDTTYWLVDPLDGTVNYINHIPFCAVSIAFILKGKPLVGVIFNPFTKELFYGARGLGVFKNQHKIKTISRKPEQTIFAVGFSGKVYSNLGERKKEFLKFQEVNDATMGCLRTGSAAMNLAYFSQGSLGGCWGKANKWWDIAAGILISELAGGDVSWKFTNKDSWLVDYSVGILPKI